MHHGNWFIGLEGPTRAPDLAHLDRVHAGSPGSQRISIELPGGRQFTAVTAERGAIEGSRYWCCVIGPRSPEPALLRALRTGRSMDEVHRACIAAECFDNSILAVDREAGRVHAWTDRLNFSPIFHRRAENQHIFASGVSLFPAGALTPDPAAVASLVLNGSCLAGGTLYRDLTSLPRAAAHALEAGGLRSSVYWRYRPGLETAARRQPGPAQDELWHLLAGSVERLTRGRPVLLALSGGYDSGVLLGLLGAELKHPNVACFSYAHGDPMPGSDAAVAAQQAVLYGYRHMTLASYRGDFIGMLDRNAEVGEGLRAPAYEIEAYPALAESAADDGSVVLFGDECFGWGSYRLRGRDDLLGAINLKSPALLAKFERPESAGALAALRNGLEARYEDLRIAAEPFRHADDAKDFLYLEQRIQNFILPLRRRIAGHWFPVALPFLAPEVLDFMATVPAEWRLDKRLFRTMARRRLPELFRIPRATRGQLHPDFAAEVLRAVPALDRRIAEQDWAVDGLFSRETLWALVRSFGMRPQGERRSGKAGLKHRVKKTAKSLLAGNRFLEERQSHLRRLGFNEFGASPGTEFMLMNLLGVADFLAAHRRLHGAPASATPAPPMATMPPESRGMAGCR